MGRQAEEEDTWEELDDSILRELSPVLDMNKHGLFQRISRQRATYFADVEDVQNNMNSQSGIAGAQPAKGKAGGASGQPDQNGLHRPSSGFADLSTWCCDAFAPVRSDPNRPGVQQSFLADQPTIALSSLFSPQPFHLADVPTVPMPSSLKSAVLVSASTGSGNSSARKKDRGRLRRFWQRLWRMCFCRPGRPLRRSRKKQSARARELVLERLRERSQQGALPRTPPMPPGGRRARIEPPPIDRLFG